MPHYSFRTSDGDADVDGILARVPPSARSWLIKEALRFHNGISSDLKTINRNIEILTGNVRSPRERPHEASKGDDGDLLAMGIEDILR